MKKIFILLLLISCIIACKKKNAEAPNNNEVKATVVLSSGDTVNINATGSKAEMWGCAPLGGGTNEANAAVYITVYDTGIRCVTSPGTYSFDCQYRPNVADSNTPIYGGTGSSITFTVINDHYMEGSFTAVVCRCISTGCVFGVDSVVVTGTFKGDRLNWIREGLYSVFSHNTV
jgi:hypothetical protein